MEPTWRTTGLSEVEFPLSLRLWQIARETTLLPRSLLKQSLRSGLTLTSTLNARTFTVVDVAGRCAVVVVVTVGAAAGDGVGFLLGKVQREQHTQVSSENLFQVCT